MSFVDQNDILRSNVPCMFHAGLRDMLTNDKDRLVWPQWTGLAGTRPFGNAATDSKTDILYVSGAGADHYQSQTAVTSNHPSSAATRANYPAAAMEQYGFGGGITADATVGYSQYRAIFAPFKSWKYDPRGIRLKYKVVRKRTYYSISNVVQTVHHYLCSRRRSQVECEDLSDNSATTSKRATQTGMTLLDFDFYGAAGRTGYTDSMDLTGAYSGAGKFTCAAHYCDEGRDPGTAFFDIAVAGENHRRNGYLRFLNRDGAWAAAIHAGMDQRLLSFGYDVPSGADTTFGTVTGTSVNDSLLTNRNIPYASSAIQQSAQVRAYGSIPGPDTEIDYTLSPHWTPMKNAFLKRLFRISRKVIHIPPGGAATITHRSRSKRGGVSLMRSGVWREVLFYQSPDDRNWGSTLNGVPDNFLFKMLPYAFPIGSGFKGPTVVYGTKRANGFQTSDLLVTVRGQMAFDPGVPSSVQTNLNYSGGNVVYRDHMVTKLKVCSYARPPLTGGKYHYSNYMNTSTAVADYKSWWPTAQPSTATVTGDAIKFP